VNRHNVVPFASSPRGALARRGAPDKARSPRIVSLREVEVECPHCAMVLSFDAGILATDPEILCAGCDESFSLYRGEAAAD
jgi:hypothetical protein